jgi:oligopeptide/dipeptide ABC transporter ATP-binding protein
VRYCSAAHRTERRALGYLLEAAVTVTAVQDAPPMLEFRNVARFFAVPGRLPWSRERRHVRAVDGVSLTIDRGATLGIVGESGCGKTTLARLALLLDRPTGGQIHFRGRDTRQFRREELKAFRSSVQAVFQDPWSSLNPRKKVFEIVTEPLVVNRRLSRGELRERANDLMRMTGLPPAYLSRWPHELSGGQRQRVAIARALSLNPALVVLDEPVSALDVSIRSQIMNLLKDLQEAHGVGYMMIGHHLPTVAYLSQRIAVMYLGKVVEVLDSQDLKDSSRHPYTHSLLAASLPSHPRDRGKTTPIIGEIPSPIAPPPGCPFHPRCARAMDVCSSVVPSLKPIGDSLVACHLYP